MVYASRTSVILLLLMIIAEIPLPLRCQPTFGLHHLFRLVGTTLKALRSIEPLEVGRRVRANVVVITDGVVT